MNKTGLSRRDFLKGTAAVAAVGGLALSGCAKEEVRAAYMPEKWDREVDVVVLGTGSILPAALRSHDKGLEVLILEKHPTYFGGTTAWCGGAITCPNTPLAIKNGFPEIPRDILMKYLQQTAQGQSTDELLGMMLDNYIPATEYLRNDCKFDMRHWVFAPGSAAYSVYTPLSVLDENPKYTTITCTVGTNAHPSGATLGRAFQAFGKDAVEARKIEIMYGAAGKKLVYKGDPALGDGEVIGVLAETASGTIAIKARYGVVIGTGGFDHNKEMVQSYLPAPIHATCAIKTNTGDGHLMAMEVGAALKNMNECYRVAFNMISDKEVYQASDETLDKGTYGSEEKDARVFTAPGKVGSIIVNKRGRRFGNESASYDQFGRNFEHFNSGFMEWENTPGYLVFDGTYNGTLGSGLDNFTKILASGTLPSYVKKFNTMQELATGMGINARNLLETVARHNEYCATGVDLEYNRGVASWDRYTCGDMARFNSGALKNPCLSPLVAGPFYCVKIYPGMLQTKGGLVINKNAQVMDTRGKVIPRLYAGAMTIANPLGKGYGWAGSTVANGYIVGYVAANHIATLTPWETPEKKA